MKALDKSSPEKFNVKPDEFWVQQQPFCIQVTLLYIII
jgi:hypothetical protein